MICLETEYFNKSTKMAWKCKDCANEWKARLSDIVHKNSGCGKCSNRKAAERRKLSLDDIKIFAENKNIICLENQYIDCMFRMNWKCMTCENEWKTSYQNLKQTGCPKCSKKQKYTLEEIKTIANKKGVICLATEYKNVSTKIPWKCKKCNYEWKTTFSYMLQGLGCKKCATKNRAEKLKYTLDEIDKIANEKNVVRLDENYIAFHKKMSWKCKLCDDVLHISFFSLTKKIKHGCSKCSGIRVLTLDDIKKFAENRNIICLATEYKNSHTKIPWECKKCNKIWYATFSNVNSGSTCPTCCEGFGERAVREALHQLFGEVFIKVRPNILKNPKTGYNLELDCYCEKLKIAAEYNGSQHYKINGKYSYTKNDLLKRQEYDKLKTKLCKQNGIKLIIIPQLREKINGRVLMLKDLKNYIKKECIKLGINLPKNYDDIKIDWSKI